MNLIIYESKANFQVFKEKLSFVCIKMKDNSPNKIYAQSLAFIMRFILRDPEADSGAKDENQSGREKIRRAKVRKKNTNPWGQTLYTPVPNGRTSIRS